MIHTKRPVVYIHRIQAGRYHEYMDQANEQLLASFADVRRQGDDPAKPTHEQLVEGLRGADGMLLLNGLYVQEITPQVLQEAGSVRVAAVAHWWEQFSVMAQPWKQAGVTVVDASDACSEGVAEWTIGAAIAGLRKFDLFDRQMKTGTYWPDWNIASQLNGSTFGLVALGRIGKYVLKYLKAYDVRILLCDPGVSASQAAELGVELVDLHTLLKTADVISLHAPVIPQTKGMIGKRELEMIRDGALLLNSARAWLLDNDAFRIEIAKKRFRAYLDVYEPEPPTADDILRTLDNVVLTPHIAGKNRRLLLRCGRFAVEALRKHLIG